jgi:hypothetical protein
VTVAARMMALFAGRADVYGTHGVPTQKGNKWEIKTTATYVRKPVTVKVWQDHIAGKHPLGIIPIRDDDSVVFGSIDVDDYVNDLLSIIDKFERASFPLLACRSKSGGLHLFLFLNAPAPAILMQKALHNIAAQLGLSGSEIFPKQAQVLTKRGDVGNWMVMPHFGSTYDGKLREQVGLRKTGAELTIEQFLSAAEANRISPEQLHAWAELSSKPVAKLNGGGHGAQGKEIFHDGPPCLQILAKTGITEMQNNSLLHMGVYFKRKNPMDWKKDLEQANREILNPPGSSDGVMSVIKSLEKKDYNYLCKTEPMCSHCSSSECRTRKFGVGSEGDYPSISGLSKLNVDPPIWFVDVNEVRLEISTDDLLNYPKFLKVCAERSNTVYNFMNQSLWLKLLGPVMNNCTNIEAPPEVSRSGHFKELLEEFCTNRQKGLKKEDLMMGRPWENEETASHYFRLKDFQKYLVKENIRDYTRGQITQRIKHLGGGSDFLNIKGNGINVWKVPSSVFVERAVVGLPEMEHETI